MTDRAIDRHADDLAAVYQEAEALVARIVQAAVENGADGTAAYYRRQHNLILAVLRELDGQAAAMSLSAASDAYTATLRAADRVLGGPVPAFGGIHRTAIDVLAEATRARLVDATTTVGRRSLDAFRRAGLKEAALGIASGATTEQVADQLRERIVREAITDATTGFVDKAGRRWPLESYSRMVARTTVREAQSAATANRLHERGQDLVTISDHNTDSKVCEPYEGRTYSLTGATPGHPVLDVLPPFHPNCEHVLTPAAATFDEWERELLAA